MDGEQKSDQGLPAADQAAPAVISQGDGPIPPAPATDEQLKETEENIEKRMSAFERSTIRLTRVAIAVSIVVGAAIIFQAVLMFRGGTDTTKIATAADQIKTYAGQIQISAQQSSTAAQNFSTAAEGINTEIGLTQKDFFVMAQNSAKSINATQQQMRLDERAWVGVGSPTFIINANEPLKAQTHVVISGKSPAVDIITRMGTAILPIGASLHLANIVLNPRVIHNGTAYPGSSFPVREDGVVPISPQEKTIVESILSKRIIFYFFGDITYRDIFKKSHWTHFCYAIPSGDVNDGSPCKIYNDSDADPDSYNQNPN